MQGADTYTPRWMTFGKSIGKPTQGRWPTADEICEHCGQKKDPDAEGWQDTHLWFHRESQAKRWARKGKDRRYRLKPEDQHYHLEIRRPT